MHTHTSIRGGVRWLGTSSGVYAIIFLAWAALFKRIIPRPYTDRGVFVSVAERLLAGDRLYIDVYDNKDPLFYYLLAIGRQVSPLMDLFIEAALIAACSLAVYSLARKIIGRNTALLVSGCAVPWMLVTSNYLAGFTHLPGVALTLASLAAASSGRSWLSGALGGLLVMMKLPMAPLPAVAILCQFAFYPKSISLTRVVGGGVLVCVSVMFVMWCRGELTAYLSIVAENVAYADSGSHAPSFLGKMADHLWRSYTPAEGVILCFIVVGLGFGIVEIKRRFDGHDIFPTIIIYTIASLASSILVLALTGMWRHHAQVLHVPAALAMMLFAPAFERWRWRGLALTGLAGGVALICVKSVLLNRSDVVQNFKFLMLPSTEAVLLREQAPAGGYARVGLNDDDPGHATALRSWKLVCPRFHQYDFESAAVLRSVLDCVSRAPFIIVPPSFVSTPGKDVFNSFVFDVNRLVAEYKCVSKDGVRVCRRPGLSALD